MLPGAAKDRPEPSVRSVSESLPWSDDATDGPRVKTEKVKWRVPVANTL